MRIWDKVKAPDDRVADLDLYEGKNGVHIPYRFLKPIRDQPKIPIAKKHRVLLLLNDLQRFCNLDQKNGKDTGCNDQQPVRS